MSDLSKDFLSITRTLESLSIPYALMGGMAASVWGEPRFTADVDIFVEVADSEIEAFVEHLKSEYRFDDPDPAAFARKLLLLRLSGPFGSPIDLLLTRYAPQISALKRKQVIQYAGHPVYICSPEDIILSKIISDRLKDTEDVRHILSHQRGQLDLQYIRSQLKTLCDSYDEYAPLQQWESLLAEAQADERLGDQV